MPADSDLPLCPDWVFLNNSNVHVAKDRGWFKTYTPFTSTLHTSIFVSPQTCLPVLGIGSVEIPTKRSPNLSGVASHGSLHLHEVLHVPNAFCNFVGQPLMTHNGCEVAHSGTKSRGTIKDSQGKNLAYFDPRSPLFAVKVRSSPTGPKLGPHVLRQGGLYMLSCRWDGTEKQKWERFKAEGGLSSGTPESAGDDKNPAYTDEEKVFLKGNWRSEFHFLHQHGLKIHDEDDRAEGRSILRAFMNEDVSEVEPEDDEFNFEGHQADYNFSHRQLDWIEKHYGNSESFMLCFGLKFYDEEDLEEAKAIADVMMADDEDE